MIRRPALHPILDGPYRAKGNRSFWAGGTLWTAAAIFGAVFFLVLVLFFLSGGVYTAVQREREVMHSAASVRISPASQRPSLEVRP